MDYRDVYYCVDPFVHDVAIPHPTVSVQDPSYPDPNCYNALHTQSWFTPCYQESTGLSKPPESDPMLESILDIRALSISSTMSSSMIPSMTSSMSSSTSSDLTSSNHLLASEYKRVWSETWRTADRMEPTDSNGRSTYLKFLSSEGGFYQCLVCPKKLDRQDRAIGHIRSHFNHRPFRCDGKCGVPLCTERFWAQSYLRSHINRPKGECDICHSQMFKQDLREHRSTCNIRASGKMIASPESSLIMDDDHRQLNHN
ncbi:hypothetical protein FRC14_000794 [Serendipita sp. 396]|nr:hypothetical protein FRC14_000794 [Serendipita sp. 396]KAG8775032.1 hypothetical protein FRC15_000840 [Serendipita sp. 397]KAG8795984.1 hypothetical protein FRC16_009873 [Serendipita sp. 398]KAG8836069.1 hypothetical protein FRC18_011892 [Serendipita sp. 400]KAG8849520.1 hypothetical protein FRB91_009809 [Serendipita sp. 411]KAG8859946.1 hypothetical protein FRC20_011739 [Serendipita sp. 405]KAG9058434.1 hypothetical protein FS842_009502 [Serendipita sp. 407]